MSPETPPPAASGSASSPAHKERLTKPQKLLRLLGGVLDPRAWAHLLKIVNYYNYTHVQPLRKLTRGPGVNISPTAAFSNPERIEIGARVNIGAGCVIWAGPSSGRIRIGDDALFGPEVMLTAASYRYEDGHPVTQQAMDEADIEIGRDVWIGTRAVILPGARIGDGAIIGAHAVVRGEVPAMGIAVGSPARVVSSRKMNPDATPLD